MDVKRKSWTWASSPVSFPAPLVPLQLLSCLGARLEFRLKSDDLIPVLRASPQSIQLHMYGVDIQPLFLQNMSLSASSLGVVPLLEDLLLDAFPALHFDAFLLFSTLESRCGEGAVLQQVSINGMAVTLT
ncbi:uncharacterized protein ARMOST_04533 [Armillaria ostoyae]|uniref:Uncharacterized protein n=1 Tax=Armillaria ostoyae TaxID=47428 RepID=A0A284QXS9_ARMOS|nr:uncharacterized protein ARMOST_04533 [Armillaria ostoyae]